MERDTFLSKLNRRQVLLGSAGAMTAFLPFAGAVRAIPVGDEEGGTPKDGGEWTVGMLEEPDTLDGHKGGTRVGGDIMRNVVDGLIAKDHEGNFVPALAESWQISEDGRTWTFHLRKDVTFHDGTPFNAEAVKFNFDRMLDPATKSAVAGGQLGPADTTTVIDEFTFEYKLKEPFAPLMLNLTDCGFTSMYSPTAVAAAGEEFGRKPVSTGPFMVEEWRQGDRIILKRNPNYNWAPAFLNHQGPAHIETLVFRSIIEDASRTAAFDAGEVDQLRAAPASDVGRYEEDSNLWVIKNLAQSVQCFEFNVTKAPFDDLAVRQALMYAVDKQSVLEAAIDGRGVIANSFLSPTMDFFLAEMDTYAPQYDSAKATELLTAAGWTDTDGDGILEKDGAKFTFELYTMAIDQFANAAQVIQSNFKDIGIEMTIQSFEIATLITKLQANEAQADILGYIYAEPDIAYLWFHSSQIGTGLNFPHVNDAKLDELIVTGRQTVDQTARRAIYEEMQKYFSDQAIWIPLYTPDSADVFTKRIHNASYHSNGFTIYTAAWVD